MTNDRIRLFAALRLVLLLAGCLVLGYWWIIENDRNQLESLQHREWDLRRTFEQAHQTAMNSTAYEEQREKLKAMAVSLLRRLPATVQVEQIHAHLATYARDQGYDLQGFMQVGAGRYEFYADTDFELNAHLDFEHFLNLAEYLGRQEQLTWLRTFHLRADSQGIQASARVRYYYYISEEE